MAINRGSVLDAVERLRARPEHVRRQIAFGTAAGITGVVAAAWLVTLIVGGSLLLHPSTPGSGVVAQSSSSAQPQSSPSPFTQLLGAVGLAGASSSAPALTPVDAATTSDDATQDQSPDASETGGTQTSIPF